MLKLLVTDRAGFEKLVKAEAGQSLMAVIRDNGFDDLLALCGGCCSCATCHVYVHSDFESKLPMMSEDENDLLESSSYRQLNSRLSCQIRFIGALDGLKVRIAPED